MRSFSSSDLERLKGSTTLCHCWKLTLKNGTVLGFTDHDRDLVLDDLVCRSESGFTGSEAEHSLGFSVGGSEITGVLKHDLISATDIDGGLYDAASVETWWVDWAQPDLRALLDAGIIGEIRRSDLGFTAEIRSLAQLFETPNGRFFSRLCSAQFGDSKCKARPILASSRILQSVSNSECYIGLLDLPADTLVGGYLIHGGERIRIRQHLSVGDRLYLRLWNQMSSHLQVGEIVQLESACNKTREICDGLYRNIANFRGFPLMPPAETIFMPPDASAQMLDGGSFFK